MLAIAAAGLLAAPPYGTQAAPCRLDIGSAAPSLAGADLSGGSQDLSNYQGKWVFVDFWATWCNPCMRELPSVVKMQQDLRGRKDFAVLSVSLDNSRSALENTASSYGISYPILYDGSGWTNSNARGWCVNAIPATFLVDPQGKVVARDINPSQVKDVIGEAAKQPDYQPMQIQSRDQLLADSPSTGRSGLKDFVLNLDMPAKGPFVSRYQLYLRYWLKGKDKQAAAVDLRYDVDITVDRSRPDFPYYVDIRETSGNNLLIEQGKLPAVAALAAVGGTVPGVSVAVDVRQKKYEFVVPLPPACTKLGYAVAVYDDRLGQFLSNGVSEYTISK